jgi:hypothetical protein
MILTATVIQQEPFNQLNRRLPANKRNSKGLVCLRNGVVAMRDLDLASRVPTKTRDDDAAKMFHAKLT